MKFQEIFGQIDKEQFIKEYLGKKFCVIKGQKGKFSSVFDWDSINKILGRHRLEYPRLRLVQRGERIEEYDYMEKVESRRGAINPVINHSKLAGYVRNGATLIIDAVNEMDDKVGQFVSEFERAFNENAQANSYTALSDNQGFVLHWDSHDVFVVQVMGKKSWRVYPPTRIHPMHNDIDKNLKPPSEDEIVWEGILEDGDILYLPRGWWHEAKPMNCETVHLSVGINHRTGIDILEWLKEKTAVSEIFRTDVPKFEQPNEMLKYEEGIRTELIKYLKSGYLENFVKETDAKVFPKSHNLSFPYVADPRQDTLPNELKLRIPTSRKLFIEDIGNGYINLKALKRNWKFSSKVKSIISELAENESVEVQQLMKVTEGILNRETVQKFLIELIRKGLIIKEMKTEVNKGYDIHAS